MNLGPAYQFYYNDFYGSTKVVLMSLEEEAAYQRLIAYQFDSGYIPADIKELAKICKNITPKKMELMWIRIGPCFQPSDIPGQLINPRMDEIRRERLEYKQKKIAAGHTGGLKSGEVRSKHSRSSASGINEANGKQTGSITSFLLEANTQAKRSSPSPSPSPSPVPSLKSSQSLISPSVPIQEPRERTNEFEKQDFQKYWGPVEKYLRSQVVEEVFQKLYAGMRILDMTARHVVVAVPQEFLNQYGGMEYGPASLKHRLEKSGTGLMRNRALKLVVLESIESALPKESRVVLAGEVQ